MKKTIKNINIGVCVYHNNDQNLIAWCLVHEGIILGKNITPIINSDGTKLGYMKVGFAVIARYLPNIIKTQVSCCKNIPIVNLKIVTTLPMLDKGINNTFFCGKVKHAGIDPDVGRLTQTESLVDAYQEMVDMFSITPYLNTTYLKKGNHYSDSNCRLAKEVVFSLGLRPYKTVKDTK